MPNPVPTINGTPATTTGGSGTSFVANLPSGIVAKELLILMVSTWVDATTITATGWFTIQSVTDGFNDSRTVALGRFADGSEGSTVTCTLGASATDIVSVAYRAGGEDPLMAIGVSAQNSATSGSTTAMTAPALTTIADNALIIRAAGTRESAGITNPASHTDIAEARTGSSSFHAALRACYTTQASAGSSGTADFVSTPGGGRAWRTMTIAIYPVLEAGSAADDRFRFRPSVLWSGTSTLGTKRSPWPDDAQDAGARDRLADNRSRMN